MADNTGNVMYTSDPFLALQLQHSDIRYSIAEKSGDIKQDLEHNFATTQRDMANYANHLNTAVLENSYKTAMAVDQRIDSLVNQNDRLFLHQDDQLTNIAKDVARQNGELTTAIVALSAEVRANADKSAQLSEIATLKNTIEMQKGNQYLAERIGSEGEKTRELVNSLKVSDLERLLLERSNELHTERHHLWHTRGLFDNSQYNGIVSQINAMNSQLAETRQGITNFGTMAAVGQSANTVR